MLVRCPTSEAAHQSRSTLRLCRALVTSTPRHLERKRPISIRQSGAGIGRRMLQSFSEPCSRCSESGICRGGQRVHALYRVFRDTQAPSPWALPPAIRFPPPLRSFAPSWLAVPTRRFFRMPRRALPPAEASGRDQLFVGSAARLGQHSRSLCELRRSVRPLTALWMSKQAVLGPHGPP